MITVGMTGSIGMGKSTVVALLRESGIPIHDADETVHRLLDIGGAAVPAVSRIFPDTLDSDSSGQAFINRPLLSRALSDDQAIKNLEAILHPLVQADGVAFRERMERDGHRLIAYDIPLLYEVGAENRVDAVICVSAPPDLQRARVMARPNMTEAKFQAILQRQMPDNEKRARADYIIENDRDVDHLRQQLQNILADLYKRFAALTESPT